MITVSGNGMLRSQLLDRNGAFNINGLDKGKQYSVKVHANGYKQENLPFIKPSQKKVNIEVSQQSAPDIDGKFHYVWEDDGKSTSGLEYASAVNHPINITVNDQQQAIPNIAAAQMLYRDYKIILEDSVLPWT
ncbi:hypothetical protein, partial [Vibrio harveyi]|uniref:hypothetical protein n=1 Tax=Vibrio harveyi TaxID=669 RepID=UPI0018F13294